jgi:cell division protein FtsL
MTAVPLRLVRTTDDTSATTRLRLVTTNPRSSRFALLLLVIAAVGVFGVVSVGAKNAEAAMQVRSLESDVDQLKRDYELLTAEVAELESPDRIRQVAVEDLGMVEADDPKYVLVDGQGRFALHNQDDGSVDDSFTDKVKQVLATQP